MTPIELGLTIALSSLVCAFAFYDQHVQKKFREFHNDYMAALQAAQPKQK